MRHIVQCINNSHLAVVNNRQGEIYEIAGVICLTTVRKLLIFPGLKHDHEMHFHKVSAQYLEEPLTRERTAIANP